MDQRDRQERTEPTLATEPTETTEASEPAEPIDRIEPADPMDRIDPLDPMDKMDPLDPMLRIEPVEPRRLRGRSPLRMEPFSQPKEGTPHPGIDAAAEALRLPLRYSPIGAPLCALSGEYHRKRHTMVDSSSKPTIEGSVRELASPARTLPVGLMFMR